MSILGFERMATLHGITIALLEQFQTAGELGIFLVVEIIDIFNISVEVIEETYKHKDKDMVRRALNGSK